MANDKLFPAYLYVGSEKELINFTNNFLKKNFCKNQTCSKCIVCNQIDKKQFYNMLWLKPENTYNTNSIEIIFDTLRFQLEEDQNFFFILEQADLLNAASANSLLKSLEEPPRGYHFILLTSYEEGILPTIASRCVVQQVGNNNISEISLLLRFFTEPKISNLQEAIKEIDKSKISERDILFFVDNLFTSYLNKLETSITNNDFNLQELINQKINIINLSREKLPMPGSSKIFLKNLLLQMIN